MTSWRRGRLNKSGHRGTLGLHYRDYTTGHAGKPKTGELPRYLGRDLYRSPAIWEAVCNCLFSDNDEEHT